MEPSAVFLHQLLQVPRLRGEVRIGDGVRIVIAVHPPVRSDPHEFHSLHGAVVAEFNNPLEQLPPVHCSQSPQ